MEIDIVTVAVSAALLAGFQHRDGGYVTDDSDPLGHQGIGAFFVPGGIVPAVDPDYFDRSIGIGCFCASCICVDRADDRCLGLTGHKAQLVGFADQGAGIAA